MAKRVILVRQEDTDRLVRLEEAKVASIVKNDARGERTRRWWGCCRRERYLSLGGRPCDWVRLVTSKPLRVRCRIYMTNSWRWQGGIRMFQKREKENKLTWFLLVYYNVHGCRCIENSCFDKVCWTCSSFFFKNWRPHTLCAYCQHCSQHMSKYVHMFETPNICPNMFICCLLPTYGRTLVLNKHIILRYT